MRRHQNWASIKSRQSYRMGPPYPAWELVQRASFPTPSSRIQPHAQIMEMPEADLECRAVLAMPRETYCHTLGFATSLRAPLGGHLNPSQLANLRPSEETQLQKV